MRTAAAVVLVAAVAAACSGPGLEPEPFVPASDPGPPPAAPPVVASVEPAPEAGVPDLPDLDASAVELLSPEDLEAFLPEIEPPVISVAVPGAADPVPADDDGMVVFFLDENLPGPPDSADADDPIDTPRRAGFELTEFDLPELEGEVEPLDFDEDEAAWEELEDEEELVDESEFEVAEVVEVRYADEPPCDVVYSGVPVLVVDGYSSWACGAFPVVCNAKSYDPCTVPSGAACAKNWDYDPCWDPCYDPRYGSWYSWWVDRRISRDTRPGPTAGTPKPAPEPRPDRIPEPRRGPTPAPAARPDWPAFAADRPPALPRLGGGSLEPAERADPRPRIVLGGRDRDREDNRDPFRAEDSRAVDVAVAFRDAGRVESGDEDDRAAARARTPRARQARDEDDAGIGAVARSRTETRHGSDDDARSRARGRDRDDDGGDAGMNGRESGRRNDDAREAAAERAAARAAERETERAAAQAERAERAAAREAAQAEREAAREAARAAERVERQERAAAREERQEERREARQERREDRADEESQPRAGGRGRK